MRLLPMLAVMLAMILVMVWIVGKFNAAHQQRDFLDRCIEDGGHILKSSDGRILCVFLPDDQPWSMEEVP